MKGEIGFGIFYFFIVVAAIGLLTLAPISEAQKTLGLYVGGFMLLMTPFIIMKL